VTDTLRDSIAYSADGINWTIVSLSGTWLDATFGRIPGLIDRIEALERGT
jgi:hypothetical protein